MKKTFLGIDPGSVRTGWTILQYYSRSGEFMHVSVIDSGSISMSKNTPRCRRINTIQRKLDDVLRCNLNIEEVFMEDAFMSLNARTSMALAQVHGVIMSSCWGILNVEPVVIPVKLIRKILHIEPQSTKKQIRDHLESRYGFSNYKGEKEGHYDQSDAAAVALAGHIGIRGFVIGSDGKVEKWKDPTKKMRLIYTPAEKGGMYPGLQFTMGIK